MTSSAVHNTDREIPAISGLLAAAEEAPVRTDTHKLSVGAQPNEENKAILVNNDKPVQPSTHNENDMVVDGTSINRLATDVTDFHIDNGAAAESTTAETPSPCTEEVPAETRPSTLDTHVNTTSTSITRHINHVEGNKTDMEATSTAVTSTEPVGIYYPPRRPNIFRARAKHLRFPEFDRNPVASHVVSKSEDAMEDDDDDFSFKDLEEFQSEAKQKMEKKTEHFLRVVQQCAWSSRVEDLGTVQEIEK